MTHRMLLLTATALFGLSMIGCKPVEVKADDKQFADALTRFDNWIRAVNEATDKITNESGSWRKESASWREALAKLEKDLKADAQDVLANEVRNIGAGLAHDFGDQPKVVVDYMEVKLKDNLKALRTALEEARKEVLEAKNKKDQGGIKRALDKLANVKVFHDPVVTGFIPSHVQINWNDHTQAAYTVRVPLIEVRGWGFERPSGESPRFSVAVADASGKERLLPPSAIFNTSRYLMQIKLDTPGVTFGKGDHKLVFSLGAPNAPDRRELPISHEVPKPPPPRSPPPPPPPPKITGITLYVGTSKNDKDREITFHYTVHRIKDGKQVGGISVGKNEVWPDDKKPNPSWRHFKILINDADRFTEVDRLGYRIHVRYDSSRGDPNWIGRLRADAEVEGGKIVPVLSETEDFEMGHHRGHPERVNRDFDFNK